MFGRSPPGTRSPTDQVGAYLARDGYHIDIPLTQTPLRIAGA